MTYSPDTEIVSIMVSAGTDLVLSLPCNMLGGILTEVDRSGLRHIPVCREEEAVGIAAGASLAGKRPLVLMQNSGLGNSINALLSLTGLYELPLFLMMSHRGCTREPVNAQKPMGKATTGLLEASSIRYVTASCMEDLRSVHDLMVQSFDTSVTGAALLARSLWL